MLQYRIDWSRLLTILLCILAGLALLYILLMIVQALMIPILMLLVAWMLSYILNPEVDFFESWGLPRALSALFTYALVAVSICTVLFLIIAPFTTQANALAQQMPDRIREIQVRLSDFELYLQSLGLPIPVQDILQPSPNEQKADRGQVIGSALGIANLLATSLINTIITFVISFYLVLDSRRIGAHLVRLAPKQYRGKIIFAQSQINRVVGGYLRSQLLTGITIGLLAGIGCWILGVQYPLVIGVLAGFLELVPMVGPILAAIPALTIAAFQPFPLVIWVLLYFLFIQQLEAHIIVPRLAGHAVGIHPLGALLALVIGTELGGLWGAIFAVPAAGVAWVFAVAIYNSLTTSPEPPSPRKTRSLPLFLPFGSRSLFKPPAASRVDVKPAVPQAAPAETIQDQ